MLIDDIVLLADPYSQWGTQVMPSVLAFFKQTVINEGSKKLLGSLKERVTSVFFLVRKMPILYQGVSVPQ